MPISVEPLGCFKAYTNVTACNHDILLLHRDPSFFICTRLTFNLCNKGKSSEKLKLKILIKLYQLRTNKKHRWFIGYQVQISLPMSSKSMSNRLHTIPSFSSFYFPKILISPFQIILQLCWIFPGLFNSNDCQYYWFFR